MADTDNTPETPAAPAAKPATRKPAARKAAAKPAAKKAPAKATAAKPAAKKPATRKPAAKKPAAPKPAAAAKAAKRPEPIKPIVLTPVEASSNTASTEELGERAREFAADIKLRLSDAIRNLGKLLGDGAEVLDQNVGPKYGDYARNASTSVRDAADRLRAKPVEDIADDAREFVRTKPAVAVGIAAVASLVVARLFGSVFSRRD